MFLIFIWDLNLKDLKDPSILARIYKYVNDTKLVPKVSAETDIEETQRILDHIYDWERLNNMAWNGTKFVRISLGPMEAPKEAIIFTLDYMDTIDQVSSTRDFGILMDDDGNYKEQRKMAVMKTNRKCSWILRSFLSRDPTLMRIL